MARWSGGQWRPQEVVIKLRGITHRRWGLLALLGLPLLALVACAATICFTDSTSIPIVKAVQQGTGGAGSFTINNSGTSNTSDALYATTNSNNASGSDYSAIHGNASGNGHAAFFDITNLTSGNDAFLAKTNGTGRAFHLVATNPANHGDAVEIDSSNTALCAQGFGGFGLVVSNTSSANTTHMPDPWYGSVGAVVENIAPAGFVNNADALYVSTNTAGANAEEISGNLTVNGTLIAGPGGKRFRIDDPLDPAGKYLLHTCVEGPERTNLYVGTVTTDASGTGVVALPAYFQALNKSYTYQLTAVGQPSEPYVAQEISGNQFTVKTAVANAKVSWQVTGVRNDAWAAAHPTEVEVPKPPEEAGLYLDPVDQGQPASKGVYYVKDQTISAGLARAQASVQQAAPAAAGPGGHGFARRVGRVVIPPR